ncbi:hypothetical protein N7G274_000816 [Stereocaulon virgatum]|uniref:Methyltransferase type 11 domain-containing protein n=1 Tax=Stereocaulon virgatum TaxID=373712 RepID=A0ABR4AM25_9LECA
MTHEARRKGSAGSSKATANFIMADCTKSTSYAGGPFDLVFGAWLLNYAPGHDGLGDTFHNIALNLKHDGHFVSITLVPA